MSYRIVCRRCGKNNKLGQMFCRHCGSRLAQSSAREIKTGGFRRFVAVCFRLLFLAALLAVLGLLLWKVEPVGRVGTEEHAKAFQQKVLRLERAADSRYSVRESFSESQVNAYLDRVVAHTAEGQEESLAQFRIDEINVSFLPDYATVIVQAGWGPVLISHELTGSLLVGEDGFTMDVTGARMGHLPMPDILQGKFIERVGRVFKDMERERKLLNQLRGIAVHEQRVNVST